MDNFLFALTIVAPIFLMMFIGFLAKCTKLVDDHTVKHINKLIFRILLPMLVFYNIYNTDFSGSFQSGLIYFCIAAILIEFFVALSIVLLCEKDNAKRGVMLQGMFRSNFVLFGIPIVAAIYGTSAAGAASLLIAVVIPLYNLLAVIALEMFNGKTPSFFRTLAGILTNPLIIASVLAVLLLVFHLHIPVFLNDAVQTVSGIATTLAFIMLGADFSFSKVGKYVKPLLLTSIFRLFIFPAMALGAAILLGYRGTSLAVLLGVFAAPIAVSSYSMTQEMGGDEKLAGQLIVCTSTLSLFTLLFFIFFLKQFAYI